MLSQSLVQECQYLTFLICITSAASTQLRWAPMTPIGAWRIYSRSVLSRMSWFKVASRRDVHLNLCENTKITASPSMNSPVNRRTLELGASQPGHLTEDWESPV